MSDVVQSLFAKAMRLLDAAGVPASDWSFGGGTVSKGVSIVQLNETRIIVDENYPDADPFSSAFSSENNFRGKNESK